MSDFKEPTPDLDVTRERQSILRQLGQQVKEAYDHRSKQTVDFSRQHTQEAIDSIKGKKKQFDLLPDNFVIDIGPFKPKPGVVTVDNSHDYPDLIRLALRKLAKEIHFFGDIEQTVAEITQHEFEHHVPGLGQERLEIRYGIEFIEDTKSNFIGYRPAIFLNGRVTLSVYKDIVSSATQPSATDSIISSS